MCENCFLRRKKECGYEPFSFTDQDGEYAERCDGVVTPSMISDTHFCDCIDGEGNVRDSDEVMAELITSGMERIATGNTETIPYDLWWMVEE